MPILILEPSIVLEKRLYGTSHIDGDVWTGLEGSQAPVLLSKWMHSAWGV
jgi:hypothetical protein